MSTVDRVPKVLISLRWSGGVRDLLRVGAWAGAARDSVGVSTVDGWG